MKGKRLLSTVLACTLVAGLCMTSASAKYYSGRVVKDGEHFVIYAFHDITYTSRSGNEMTYDGGDSWAAVKPYASLEEIYKDFADPDNEDTHFKNVKDYTDPENPTIAVKETDDLSILVLSAPGKEDNSLEEQLIVSNREAQIGTYNLDEAVTLKLNGGAKVENGVLLIMNDSPAGKPTVKQNMDIELGAPITVGEGGHLILDTTDLIGGATLPNYKPERANKLIAPAGQSAIEVNGGKVEIAFQEIARAEDDSSEEPLIDVQSGEASFVMNTGRKDNDGLPMYGDDVGTPGEDLSISLDNGESSVPAVAVAEGASATIKGGELTSSGAPVFELAEGASLTLKGGTISNTSEDGTPAIEVAGGAELIYADGADVEISAAAVGEEGAAAKAVSLGAGAKVQVADTKVTVASDNEAGDYIDNHGVMVLSAGATKGEDDAPMNAALVMGDGTIIEGSKSAAPTYTVDKDAGKITTTVPAGGKVTDSEGKTVEMPNGGSVTSTEDGSDVEVEKVPATGITLDKTSVTLYSNTTPNTVTLTATVQPSNTTDTVVWSSSDENVATVNNGVVTAVSNGTATITAKAGDQTATCTVTVKTYSSGGGSSSDDSDPTYSISAPDKVTGGSIKVTPNRASAGTRVTITAKPSSGYELDELTVTDSKGNELKVTDRGDSKYTFQMPSGKVEIEVSFTKIEATPDPDPSTGFVDVPANAYYADAVKWAVSKGITSGTSTTTFSPNTSCTRAQMVTFLWRAAGSPAPKSTVNPFTDVQAGSYYYDAVLWAVEQGITSGTSATTFAPDATVTRAQTVTFLYRAAGSPAVTGGSFADVAADAYYAAAVAWAVSENITAGTGNGLFTPDTACSRAQIVTFLYRDAL